ncbi:hypothetical protein [Paenibacillus harenae]|uniref:hypothetical protein n=1 Tax=Paenibacillus harenae TaxID=306543 RepID=UPI00278DB19E|nr:hypothetical protein [Paenibacillus harenae]MDQ0062923.1 hypothetical protein [Paenibacillus harenae]
MKLPIPSRVIEFISFYETADLNHDEKFALMSLIISSYDNYLSEGNFQESTWENIKKHLVRDMDLHRKTILYWSLVEEELDDCFCITPNMRQIFVP